MAWVNLDEDLAELFAPFVERSHEIDDANERWRSDRRQQAHEARQLDGASARRDPAPVRAHVAVLVAAGVPLYRIALVAGVDESVLRRLPTAKRIRPHIAARILAVTASAVTGSLVLVDAAPAREHLTRLAREGINAGAVATTARVAYPTVYAIATGRRRKTRPETARQLLAVTAASIVKKRGGGGTMKPLDPDRFEHGTVSRYRIGCRCDRCRRASRLGDKPREGT
jgi:hypothetical protein